MPLLGPLVQEGATNYAIVRQLQLSTGLTLLQCKL